MKARRVGLEKRRNGGLTAVRCPDRRSSRRVDASLPCGIRYPYGTPVGAARCRNPSTLLCRLSLSATAKWIGLLAGTIVLVLGAGVVDLSRRPPEFYARALEQPPEKVRERARDFMRHATQLASDVENLSRWEAAFRQDDVNAWLSHDFLRDHGGLLPDSLHDPRVAFEDDHLIVAFRKGTGWFAPVFSLTVALWLPEPNLLAIELRDGRAGSLPVSITGALRKLAARTAELGWDVQWKQRDGNPVAMLRLRWESVCKDLAVEDVRIENGTFYVAGTSNGCQGGAVPQVTGEALRFEATKPPTLSVGFPGEFKLAVKPASR